MVHDSSTFLEHTTDKTVEEDSSTVSDYVKTEGSENTDLCPSDPLPDEGNKHLTFHPRGIPGTTHNDKTAMEETILRLDSRDLGHVNSSSPTDGV